MNVNDISWSAGLFEGEGCVSFVKYKHSGNGKMYGRLRAQVTSTDLDVLEKLKRLWGGYIYKIKLRKEGYKQAYTWTVMTCMARQFLLTIVSLLHKRRFEQVRVGLSKDINFLLLPVSE